MIVLSLVPIPDPEHLQGPWINDDVAMSVAGPLPTPDCTATALASTAILGTWSLLVYYHLLGNGGEDGII